MVKKWVNELQQCEARGDIVGACRALNKIMRLGAIIAGMCVVITFGTLVYYAAQVWQTHKAYTLLPSDKDIVGNTVICVDIDGEERLLVCDYAKVFVSAYDELNDDAYEERYEWVDTADDNTVVMGVYNARLDNNLFATVVKYYDNHDRPNSTIDKNVIVEYVYTLSYSYDVLADDARNAPIVTVQ